MSEYTKEELEQALVQILDGQSNWYEIRESTGLDKSVCVGIESLCKKVCRKMSILESLNRKAMK